MDPNNNAIPPQRVCILGGGGYLGQHLAKALQEQGHFVVILDLSFPNFSYIPLDLTRIKRIQGSITERNKLDEAMRGCDACFHIAGYGMSGGSSLDRRMTFAVNVGGTEKVLQHCRKNGVRRLVYTSSVSVVFNDKEVYDLDESAPYLEKFLCPYAESKCIAEQMVLQANVPGHFHTCALRFRGIYGPGEMRTTQRTVDLFMKGLIKMTFEKNGSCLTQYSSIDNSVDALLLAERSLHIDESPAAGKTYNIVDGGPPVEAIKFWFPLMEYFGVSRPKIRVPYILVYMVAFFMELLYHIFGLEPLMTRLEVNLVAVTNTFSIENARKDLGYNPKNNHSWDATIKFYEEMKMKEKFQLVDEKKGVNKASRFPVNVIILKTFIFMILAVFSTVFVPYFIVNV